MGGGDGFFTVMHPTNTEIMFAESQGGNVARVNLAARERASIRPFARPTEDDADRRLRWNWNTPILLSSHDDQVVYAGSNILFRSPDLGQSWEEISPDLTWAIDRDTLELMDVKGSEPQMSRNDGQSTYGNLTALAESPLDPAVLYTGSDDGRVHATRDGGASWTDVTASARKLPPYTYVTRIVASRGKPGGVYAVFDGHKNGLPTAPVDDIVVHPRENDLVIGTHGLGIWIMDDIAPLQELSDEVMASAAHLYPVRRATSYNPYFPQGWTPGIYAAPNPPAGARIRYHLGSEADSVKIRITDNPADERPAPSVRADCERPSSVIGRPKERGASAR